MIGLLALTLLSGLWLYKIHQGLSTPTLANIKQAGVLRIITFNSPTTYYEDATGPTGFEYELAKLFAQELGVSLEVDTTDSFGDLYTDLEHHKVALAAAGITITPDTQKHLLFSSPYQATKQILIYNRDYPAPRTIADLTGKLTVTEDSNEANNLLRLRQEHPELAWQEHSDQDTVDLLDAVDTGESDYTIINSNEWLIYSAYYLSLDTAFDISQPKPVAWAFAKDTDPALLKAANTFLAKMTRTGKLAELQERFYGHAKQLNYVGVKNFIDHINTRLPTYANLFEQSAQKEGLDWRFLAAISYQESKWEPDATSPTGVRGLMMLTEDTARSLGVNDRLNPEQSIEGGARYFVQLKNDLPEKITEPDRTWLALAAYNVGLGHLQDAMLLAKKRGLNQFKWVDVKQQLPLLQKPAWFSKTRHGYARGYEPVIFVQNIRRYVDVITWAQDQSNSHGLLSAMSTSHDRFD
jgi:membrane-bound lytic murein transglycosylase F